ncbi:MAG TPA: AmmeMemoRadiSam system protein A, partial [Spirochaetota bacterium]|nr:AmmeMemoRadiSam system protein A [Spirochaetota bacterium]
TVLTDTRLDHGAGVPLYFFHKAGITKPFFICSPDYYSLEGSIKAAAAFSDSLSGRDLKFAAIASADLSHALKPGAPAGFDPRGQKFDDQLTAFIKSREYTKIKTINPELQQLAHQDAMETIMMALTLSNFKTNNSRFLSYENEFGVGYLCAVLSCT